MPDDGPPNPPPNPTDPWLEGLTFEQIAQLVNEVNPDVFYQRASAFDQGAGGLQHVLDRVRHELNVLRESWNGKGSDDFDALAREVTGKADSLLQFLQNPGYGTVLRNAGDQLAAHQRRFQDLQGQKSAQEAAPPATGGPTPEETQKANNDSAKQILRDLRTAYWDVGNAMAPLPFKTPKVTATDVPPPANQPPATNNNAENGEHDPNDTTNNSENPPHLNTLNALAVPPPGPTANGPFLFGGNGDRVIGRDQRGGQHDNELYQLGGDGQDGPYQPVGQDLNGLVDPGPQGYGSERPQENILAAQGETLPASVEPGASMGFMPGVMGGVLGAGMPPAVLGRSEKRDTCRPVMRTDKVAMAGEVAVPGKGTDRIGDRTAGRDRKKVVEEQELLAENRPETVSSETVVPGEIKVRTAVDAPETVEKSEVTEKIEEIAAAAVTSSGEPLIPAQATEPAPEVPATKPEEQSTPVDTSALTKKPLSFSASAGGGGGAHMVAAQLDPEARGMFAPTANPDALVAGQLPGEPAVSPAATAGSPRGQADPYSSQHMGGMPMSPMMMGGMGGGMSQQNGRMAAMPNEPRPEVWDPLTGAPIALGRREPAPAPEPSQEKEQVLTPAEVQARLAEKFAELDRLMERGK